MLYAIYGARAAKKKLEVLVSSMLAKKPDSSLLRFDAESFDPLRVEELLYGQGLFEKKYIVILEGLLADEHTKAVALKYLKAFGASENIFLLLEGELTRAVAEKIEKYAEKVQEFPRETKEKKKFEVFALTDAFGRRDRKRLWVLYTTAKHAGVSDEEIHGLLFWQVRSMLLASSSGTAHEAGQNPFVFRKARDFAKNFQEGELERVSLDLVRLYHDARRGLADLSISLERFILTA